jgi:hypothetical protein
VVDSMAHSKWIDHFRQYFYYVEVVFLSPLLSLSQQINEMILQRSSKRGQGVGKFFVCFNPKSIRPFKIGLYSS